MQFPQWTASPVVGFPSCQLPQWSVLVSFPSGRFPHWSVPRWSVSVGVSRSVSVGVGQFPQWSVSNSFPVVSFPVDGFPIGQCRSVVSFSIGRWSVSPLVSGQFPSGQFPQWSVSVSGQFPQWSVSPRGLCCWSVSRAVRFPSGRSPPQLKQARP